MFKKKKRERERPIKDKKNLNLNKCNLKGIVKTLPNHHKKRHFQQIQNQDLRSIHVLLYRESIPIQWTNKRYISGLLQPAFVEEKRGISSCHEIFFCFKKKKKYFLFSKRNSTKKEKSFGMLSYILEFRTWIVEEFVILTPFSKSIHISQSTNSHVIVALTCRDPEPSNTHFGGFPEHCNERKAKEMEKNRGLGKGVSFSQD